MRLTPVGLFLASQIFIWYGVKWIVGQMDPLRKKKDESAEKAREIFGQLGVVLNLFSFIQIPYSDLNEYEQIIAGEIVRLNVIQLIEDVGGLDDIVSSLREAVLYPLTLPHLFSQDNQLLGPPKGVLLYGPPGCGKTLIAKALAKESKATFVNLHVSTLTEKWYGESQKLVRALFSLAKKLQPTIIFIDEIDSFLRERHSSDHEVTGMMKAEFMSLWDGLSSTSSDRVMILGATNRYHDIDKAIIRRMPQRFPIGLPELHQRQKILSILLKDTEIVDRDFTITRVAALTAEFSGSDLKELCRNVVMVPVREYFKSIGGNIENVQTDQKRRSLSLDDFILCLKQGDSQTTQLD